MKIKDIARICHEANRAYCIAHDDNSLLPWDEAPEWQRESSIAGVMFARSSPNSTPEDMHKSWMEMKRAEGWKYGATKDAEKKEHPCFREYHELPEFQHKKDELFLAIVRALL